MATNPNVNKVKRLRERDGESCWLCLQPIEFNAKPNSPRAWSIEHLLAKKHGGTGKIENLVLCHPPCNRKLMDLSVAEKIKLRDQDLRERWLKQLVERAFQTLAA